jgi:hypothetical protein
LEPRPLTFVDGWADTVFDGAPLVETVLQAFVGRCQACGRRAETQREGSVLVNVLAVEGTLYGDTLCAGCFDGENEPDDGLVFFLPPVTRDERDVRRYFEGW